MAGEARPGPVLNGRKRSTRIRRRLGLAAVAGLLALVLVAQDSTVLVPNLASYRIVDQRTIAVTVGVAPCSWTRVTNVGETPAEVRIRVETLPCPIPGPGTSALALRELMVPLLHDVGSRAIADTDGHPIPVRHDEPGP